MNAPILRESIHSAITPDHPSVTEILLGYGDFISCIMSHEDEHGLLFIGLPDPIFDLAEAHPDITPGELTRLVPDDAPKFLLSFSDTDAIDDHIDLLKRIKLLMLGLSMEDTDTAMAAEAHENRVSHDYSEGSPLGNAIESYCNRVEQEYGLTPADLLIDDDGCNVPVILDILTVQQRQNLIDLAVGLVMVKPENFDQCSPYVYQGDYHAGNGATAWPEQAHRHGAETFISSDAAGFMTKFEAPCDGESWHDFIERTTGLSACRNPDAWGYVFGSTVAKLSGDPLTGPEGAFAAGMRIGALLDMNPEVRNA